MYVRWVFLLYGSVCFALSAQRFITGFDVSPAFVIDGKLSTICSAFPFFISTATSDAELVKITIRGQAFLLNQIRHMIGLCSPTLYFSGIECCCLQVLLSQL